MNVYCNISNNTIEISSELANCVCIENALKQDFFNQTEEQIILFKSTENSLSPKTLNLDNKLFFNLTEFRVYYTKLLFPNSVLYLQTEQLLFNLKKLFYGNRFWSYFLIK